jgi:uncharacterized protein YbbK (DUF523 family)
MPITRRVEAARFDWPDVWNSEVLLMQKILVSACLLGQPVRYNAGHKRVDDELLARWQTEGRVVAVCPEVAGGLPVPRPPAEIQPTRSAAHVWLRQARVLDVHGTDVTTEFVRGAEHALAVAQAQGIRMAVLKESSPSCGSSSTHDGTFSGVKVAGEGVTAARLRQAGIVVFSEARLQEAAVWLAGQCSS